MQFIEVQNSPNHKLTISVKEIKSVNFTKTEKENWLIVITSFHDEHWLESFENNEKDLALERYEKIKDILG